MYKCILSWILTCLLIFPFSLVGQQTLSLDQQLDSARVALSTNPDIGLQLAREIIQHSPRSDYYAATQQAWRLIANYYYQQYQTDSSLYYTYAAHQSSIEANRPVDVGNNLLLLADNYVDLHRVDTAHQLYKEAFALFSTKRDTAAMCRCEVQRGNMLVTKGDLDRSAQAFFSALTFCGAVGDSANLVNSYITIGRINEELKSFEQSESYYLKGLAIAQFVHNQWGETAIYNNLGILYKNWGKLDQAYQSYQRSLALSAETNNEAGIFSGTVNMGILDIKRKNFEAGIDQLSDMLPLATESKHVEAITDIYNWMARGYIGLNDLDQAEKYALIAEKKSQEIEVIEKQVEVQETLSDLYAAQGNYVKGFDALTSFKLLSDSMINISKVQQINTLQEQFESQKKEQEIAILEKNAELEIVKKKQLRFGLVAAILLGVLSLVALWQKRKRDQKILQKEKQLAIQRRKNVELENEKLNQELTFQKQELAAKVLQLCRKNEFLQGLERKINALEQSGEKESMYVAKQIGHQIQSDMSMDEEWNDFVHTFSTVHRDFLPELQEQYGNLSKSDMRLACLLKMNLSTKEVANMLNISGVGVKKARYRLRKKLNLPSEIDLSLHLGSFPSNVLSE